MAEPSLSDPWTIHGLPSELMGLVLSFLPLPALCRMRTVCKNWNHIICSSSFHDSYEERDHHGVCFLKTIDRSVMRGTTCFLDFNKKRWYLIKGQAIDYEFVIKKVVMGDGLVAEFCAKARDSPTVCIQMSDAILKKRWRIDPCPCEDPNLSSTYYKVNRTSLVVMGADHGSSRMFRIFLFDNSGFGEDSFHQCLWIYESSTNNWRSGSPPPRKGSYNNYARSAVILFYFYFYFYFFLVSF
ncbi:hypothetical protein KC19_1G104400 [Ceratodon purpureus]|uniref:F-box domain-containing protein n=1 Tax=Ceratodon purpureus TaxID=3225 RepID=A0A8T0J3J6_CERPU|nr:hypothetical protein KC19_1G104400 [Ceratodon purpureus]